MASERCECGHGNEEHALRYDLDGPSPCRVCSCTEYRPTLGEAVRECIVSWHSQQDGSDPVCDTLAALVEAAHSWVRNHNKYRDEVCGCTICVALRALDEALEVRDG